MAKGNSSKSSESFESTLWQAADKLRKNMDAAEYKHIEAIRRNLGRLVIKKTNSKEAAG